MMKTSIKPECTTCTYKQQRMSMNSILQNLVTGIIKCFVWFLLINGTGIISMHMKHNQFC